MRNFTFSKKWYDILKEYPKEIQNSIYVAVLEYAFTGETIKMEPVVRMAFDFIKYDIDERTHRREVRAAKATTKSATKPDANTTEKTTANSPSPISKSVKSTPISPKELVENYYKVCQAPGAVRMRGGFGYHDFDEDRILTLVEITVNDLLEKSDCQPGSPEFYTRLHDLVDARFNAVCHEMKRYAEYGVISNLCWNDMFNTVRRSHAA